MKRLLLLGAMAATLAAQGVGTAPPIVQIVTRAGGAESPVRPYQQARAAIDVMGLAATTGLPQTWMLEMHGSFASVEELDRAIRAYTRTPGSDSAMVGDPSEDLIGPPRTMIAVFNPRLSYRADEAIRLFPRARYLRVTIHRIRVGLEAEFAELVRLRKLTIDSINVDRPELVYHVISGAPSGTYLVLAPFSTLRTLDEGVADLPTYAEPVADARAKAAPKAADFEISRENLLFRVEPQLSYVSDEFAGSDKTFWRGR